MHKKWALALKKKSKHVCLGNLEGVALCHKHFTGMDWPVIKKRYHRGEIYILFDHLTRRLYLGINDTPRVWHGVRMRLVFVMLECIALL